MKKLIPLLFILWSCSPDKVYDQTTINYEGEEILVGPITLERLKQEPFAEWYNLYYEGTPPNTEQLDQIADELYETKITLFLGTWCSDSREQIPGFIRMLKYSGYDFDNLNLIGIERKEDRSLVSPGGEEKGLNITHVPTYIFYQKGNEIGRIVEFPEKTLEEDMAKIIK